MAHFEATIAEYEQVREDGFVIVEKVHTAARALVRRLNPRTA